MYQVAIRNNSTKEVRVIDYDCEWQEHSTYMWVDGNFSCDCNRHVFFMGEENDEHAVDIDCSDGKYSCLYAILEDGLKIDLEEGEERHGK